MRFPTLLVFPSFLFAVEASRGQHDHLSETKSVKPPRVFLDKSPRIVAYQLQRLSNEQLLAVQTQTTDSKFAPVFQAILTREGMAQGYREQALADLVATKSSEPVKELLDAMQIVAGNKSPRQRTIKALADMLLAEDVATLQTHQDFLLELAASKKELLSQMGFAALLALPDSEQVWLFAEKKQRMPELLAAIDLIPSTAARSKLRARVIQQLDSEQPEIQQAAIRSLSKIPANQRETFERIAPFVRQNDLRAAAVETLLSIPTAERAADLAPQIVAALIDFAQQTPAASRTENEFLDAAELIDELLAELPREEAAEYRQRLREIAVRVIRIRTVEEEMRYDTSYFAVEAGRPVQVVLINEDLMPHNFVLTTPGALKAVADAGMEVGPDGGASGKPYVPDTDQVLNATSLVPAFSQERLTFTAPTEAGEYPYVCTFPRHWMRMYGVMVVVDDLDAWLKEPVEPTDPLGSNRAFVQDWKIEDFEGKLAQGLLGRSTQIGERIFQEATCAQCHRVGEYGSGQIGPDLAEVFAKYKQQPLEVLREILTPSYRIDDRYAVHLVLDVDGHTSSGLIVADDRNSVSLLEDPEAEQPKVINKSDIEQMVKTSTSMMPKGLMDRFTKDEIFELLSFLQQAQR